MQRAERLYCDRGSRLYHGRHAPSEMEQETADPLAARLVQDVISDMQTELKEQFD